MMSFSSRQKLLSLPLLSTLILSLLSACVAETPHPEVFPVATEEDAAARLRSFFDAISIGDVDLALSFICGLDADDAEDARAFVIRSQSPSAPLRVDLVDVLAVSSHWVGREPTFWVDAAFPRRDGSGTITRAYRIHVRSGCIENVVRQVPMSQDSSLHDVTRSVFDPSEKLTPRIPRLPPPTAAIRPHLDGGP